jgi:hypothetical protein
MSMRFLIDPDKKLAFILLCKFFICDKLKRLSK